MRLKKRSKQIKDLPLPLQSLFVELMKMGLEGIGN